MWRLQIHSYFNISDDKVAEITKCPRKNVSLVQHATLQNLSKNIVDGGLRFLTENPNHLAWPYKHF